MPPSSLNQVVNLPLNLLLIGLRGKSRSHRQAIERTVQLSKNIREEYSNGFECKHVGERDPALKSTDGPMNSAAVSTNVSHVPNQWPNDFHEDVRPKLFGKGAGLLDFADGVVDRRRDLLDEHLACDYRQIASRGDSKSQNLFRTRQLETGSRRDRGHRDHDDGSHRR